MTSVKPPPASLRLRVDTGALAANWRYLDSLSGAAETGAAVKADAYGLGIDKAVPALRDAGARQFFLAHWSEVPALLRHVDPGDISVLHGPFNAEDCAFARSTGAIPVINSLQQANMWNESGGGRCHLMIDTGINRLGVSASDLSDPAIGELQIDVAMSHLASADEDCAQNAAQLEAFRSAAQHVSAKRLSLANSAGIMLGTDYHFDLTRPGLALYGGTAHPAMEREVMQVAYPEAAVIQVRRLSAGDSVGYNAIWTADRDVQAATVSIGYADGFLRALGKGGALHHDGQELPIIGKVSMDMIVVDVSAAKIYEGDFLSIPFDLLSVSSRSGLSQYELLTVLGHRFERS